MTSPTTLAAEPAAVDHATPYADVAYLTRELHDTVAHSLSGIALAAAGARRVAGDHPGADPVPVPGAGERGPILGVLRAIEACAVEAMTDLHALLGLMRAGAGLDAGHADDAGHAGHAGATDRAVPRRRLTEVADLIARTQAAGLAVVLDERGRRRRLDRRVEHVAYRVVQEGLTNAMKYAGVGAAAQVRLGWSAERLKLTVSTFGRTRAPGAGGTGQGLAGLAQRVITLGGRFAAGPDGAGFRIEAVLPIAPRELDVTPTGPPAHPACPRGS